MVKDQIVWWETCSQAGCLGVRLAEGKCLAHSSRVRRRWMLRGLRRGRTLDVRGILITPALLSEIMDAAPKDPQGHVCLPEVDFTKATFQDDAVFDSTTFQARALFLWTTFQGWAGFNSATFQGDTRFDGAIFLDRVEFGGATFQEWAEFGGATFQRGAGFVRANFLSSAGFDGATFRRTTTFSEATFHSYVWSSDMSFHHDAEFKEVSFEQARQLGPILVRKRFVFDHAIFKQRVEIHASAAVLSFRGARFPAGVLLRLRWAQVILDGADLAAPSILTGAELATQEEGRWARLLEVLSPPRSQRPRLLSVRNADVAGLTVSNVDLQACRFLGVHNLDKLRLEGEQLFAGPPSRWYLARRQTLAEEHHWRHDRRVNHQPDSPHASGAGNGPMVPSEQHRHEHGPTDRWYSNACQPPPWLEAVEPPQPGQVAELYRALRKGREDAKDEPGAADFYYGEMELRRHARWAAARDAWWSQRRPAKERRRYERSIDLGLSAGVECAILSAYWLVSGYALRAWRALATFVALLLLFALLVTSLGGFAPSPTPAASPSSPSTTTTASVTPTSPSPTVRTVTADTSFGGALVFGARTVFGLAREPQPRLTRWGDVLQILLRILGPVVLGLAILSVRGRVKR